MRVWASAKARNGRFSKFALEFGAEPDWRVILCSSRVNEAEGRRHRDPAAGRRTPMKMLQSLNALAGKISPGSPTDSNANKVHMHNNNNNNNNNVVHHHHHPYSKQQAQQPSPSSQSSNGDQKENTWVFIAIIIFITRDTRVCTISNSFKAEKMILLFENYIIFNLENIYYLKFEGEWK